VLRGRALSAIVFLQINQNINGVEEEVEVEVEEVEDV
jgi:hypothetical protein